MSEIKSKQEERMNTPLGKSKAKENRTSYTNPDGKKNKELAKRNRNADSMQANNSDVNAYELSYQKSNFLEELGDREEEIRKMLYESKPIKPRESYQQERANKKSAVNFDLITYVQDSDDEECTFQPKINPNTHKILKRQNTDQPVNEVLYKSAFHKKAKDKEAEAEVRQSLSKIANSNKISINSMKMVFKRIETALRNLIREIEDPNNPEKLTFENVGVILSRLGVFQNLEFSQSEEPSNRSSLALNQSKVRPQILAREITFHENLWKILITTSHERDYISSEILFRFLMVLLEDKASISESSSFLHEIINLGLEGNDITGEDGLSPFERVKGEYNLWELDKLVTEFRKLFTDKTLFMNIYSSVGVLTTRKTIDDKQNTFKPQINPKSKDLDLKSNENYKGKIIHSQSTISPSKFLNRNDMLFEYHKYLQEKKNENLEIKIEKELASCTFKPQIKEYKKKDGNQNQSSLSYSNLDVSKAKRHDLLYEVAKVQKEKLNQKAYETKKMEETKELSKCTFQPKINSRPEEYSEIHQGAISGPPKGFKKAIERMQTAEKLREEKKAEREYIPRGEKYEKLKQAEFKPPSFLSRPKIKKQEPLVYVDVNIGPGKTGRIGIHRGDDARTLAKNFARTYSLPPVMKESLEKLLQTYIDSYFPEKEPDQEEVEEEEEEEEQEEDEEEEEEEDVKVKGKDHQDQRQQPEKVEEHAEEEEEDDEEEGEEDEEDEEDEEGGEEIDYGEEGEEDEDEDDEDEDEDEEEEEEEEANKNAKNRR